MKKECCAVIVENRFDVSKTIDAHVKFLPKDWTIIHIQQPINSIEEYNELLTSRAFWAAMLDKVLIFQWDSTLLRTGIEEYIDYDFIGAPIKHIPFPAMNGGLSLRSKEMMLKVIDNIPYNGENEDMYFCNGIMQLKGKLPTKEIAQSFSVETIFGFGSLGVHAIENWLTTDQCNLIRTQYDYDRTA